MKELLMKSGPMPGWASYSAIGTFRACPQRWKYAYLQRLERPVDTSDAKVELQFGIWWHALRAAEAIETGRERESLLICPKTIETPAGDLIVDPPHTASLPQRVSAMAVEWAAKLPEEHKAQWRERLGEELPERLAALDKRWHLQWDTDNEWEDPIGVEVKWTRALPVTGTELLGYIDLIYRDRRRGVVAVRDYKSMKALDSQTSVDDMMDSQLQLYVWGAIPLLSKHGLKIAAISYDRAKTVKATEPKLTQMGGLSKSVTQFDWLTYQEWVDRGQVYPGRMKDGSQSGTYELDPVVMENLRSPAWVSRWFQRTMVPLNLNLVKAHLYAAIDTVNDMTTVTQRLDRRDDAPRNLNHNNCRWCDFSALCRAQMMGGPDGEYPLADFGLVAK